VYDFDEDGPVWTEEERAAMIRLYLAICQATGEWAPFPRVILAALEAYHSEAIGESEALRG